MGNICCKDSGAKNDDGVEKATRANPSFIGATTTAKSEPASKASADRQRKSTGFPSKPPPPESYNSEKVQDSAPSPKSKEEDGVDSKPGAAEEPVLEHKKKASVLETDETPKASDAAEADSKIVPAVDSNSNNAREGDPAGQGEKNKSEKRESLAVSSPSVILRNTGISGSHLKELPKPQPPSNTAIRESNDDHAHQGDGKNACSTCADNGGKTSTAAPVKLATEHKRDETVSETIPEAKINLNERPGMSIQHHISEAKEKVIERPAEADSPHHEISKAKENTIDRPGMKSQHGISKAKARYNERPGMDNDHRISQTKARMWPRPKMKSGHHVTEAKDRTFKRPGDKHSEIIENDGIDETDESMPENKELENGKQSEKSDTSGKTPTKSEDKADKSDNSEDNSQSNKSGGNKPTESHKEFVITEESPGKSVTKISRNDNATSPKSHQSANLGAMEKPIKAELDQLSQPEVCNSVGSVDCVNDIKACLGPCAANFYENNC